MISLTLIYFVLNILGIIVCSVILFILYIHIQKTNPTIREYCRPINEKLFGWGRDKKNESENPPSHATGAQSEMEKEIETKDLKSDLKKQESEYNKIQQIQQKYKNEVENLRKDINLLNRQLNQLYCQQQKQAEAFISLKRKIEMNGRVKETVVKEIALRQSSVPVSVSPAEVLYASPPQEGSSFFGDISQTPRAGIDFYEIRMKPGTMEGTFIISTHGFDRKFINNFSVYGKSACDVIRGENNIEGFHTLTPGICEKNGNKWIIKKKTEIELV